MVWILNLWGSDVYCNLVFVSYFFIMEYSFILYIIENKLLDEVKDYLIENEIKVRFYLIIEKDLKDFIGKFLLLVNINVVVYVVVCVYFLIKIVFLFVFFLKVIKNEIEIEGFYCVMKCDGVVMVKFFCWLKVVVFIGNEIEISIDKKLYEFCVG